MRKNNNASYKESRELRDREIQTQTQRYISRFNHCSTSPPSHRRISTMSTKDLPQKDLRWEITIIQTRST